MLAITFFIGIVLVIAVLIAIFRVHSLLGVARSKSDEVGKPDPAANNMNAVLFIVFTIVGLVAFVGYSVSHFDLYTLPLASKHGQITDTLFWITTGVTVFVFVLTNVLLFYFSFKYRYKETNTALFYPDNDFLEKLWTIVPAIVLTLLIGSGAWYWVDIMKEAPKDAENVEIMGYQFAWKVRYPGEDNQLGKYDFRMIDADNLFGMDFSDESNFDDFVPRELHIPKGKPVKLNIRARDVLHSVFIPHLRVKMDAVPGMPTTFWFVADKSTADMRKELKNPEFDYEIACTEVCGKGHFSMKFKLVIDEPDEYEKWKSEQEPWLKKNPDYLSKVPEELRSLAESKSGIKENKEVAQLFN